MRGSHCWANRPLIPLSIKAVASNGEQEIDAPTVAPFTLRVVEHHLPVEVDYAHDNFSLLDKDLVKSVRKCF